MNTSILEEIGLTKSERELYLSLLKLGSSKTGKITKEVNMHRSRVYESLSRLMEKGLVSSVKKNNIKYFQAAPPSRLTTYLEEKKEELSKKEKKLKEVIKNLEKIELSAKPEAESHIFTGLEGFKTIRKDVLKQKKDLYMIGAKGTEYKFLKYFFPNFNTLRIKSKIKWKVLYDHGVKGKKMTKLPLMESKFLHKEYSTPVVINIYADRVVNILWQGETPLCFMIINKDVADSYRKWFELLWKVSES